jgi:ferric-dicitrate binding protein FerR (iron transport regulator)
MILAPGQQAQVGKNGIRLVNNADMSQVMAWKNGVFNFQDVSLKEVMRQLARWYDIDIVYEKEVPDIEFEGEINRGNTLTVVLKSLEKLGVHFRLEERRRLVVLP